MPITSGWPHLCVSPGPKWCLIESSEHSLQCTLEASQKRFQNMTSLPTISSLCLCKTLRKHVTNCDQRSRNKQFRATKPTLYRFRYAHKFQTIRNYARPKHSDVSQDNQTHLDIPNSRCLRTIAANGQPFLICSSALVAA